MKFRKFKDGRWSQLLYVASTILATTKNGAVDLRSGLDNPDCEPVFYIIARIVSRKNELVSELTEFITDGEGWSPIIQRPLSSRDPRHRMTIRDRETIRAAIKREIEDAENR
jgi:hypothetical protein